MRKTIAYARKMRSQPRQAKSPTHCAAGCTESKVNTTTATPTPEALAISVIFKDFEIDHTPDGWPAVKQMHLNAAAAELERQHAEIERLTAENKALRAKIELIDYVLQDNLHNRLTPRVVDIAYSAFASGRGGRSEDGEPCDWFNDTKPRVVAWIDKIKKDLAEEAAYGIGEKP